MENVATLEPQTAERLLIYENSPEQQRILNEIENRRSILNRLANVGLSKEEITSVASSLDSIDKYIFKKQLEENNALKKLIDRGIKGLSADLSPQLNQLSFDLKAWHNYRMPNKHEDKFSNLICIDSVDMDSDSDRWQVDEEAIENLFIKTGHKFYIEGEQIREYRELEKIIEYLENHRCPNNQVVASTFLNSRIEPIGQFKFMVRWQYFRK
jgi:hypothetical protein